MDHITALVELLSEDRVSTNETTLRNHGKDESHHTEALPHAVVFPKSTEEVSGINKIASQYEVPVIPFGLGSSLEGHVIPYQGGITVDFSLMNQIIEIRENDFLVKVQPGITRTQLNKALKQYGLFFPVDPGADATIGGMIATNASGTTSVRYGVMSDQVRNLEVVLADGNIIQTGSLAVKSSSGYHLNSLFVGSEGTLGLFTEITLQVYGIPEYTTAARAVFPTVSQAVDAVVKILQAGIPIARCELVDSYSMKQVNHHSKTNYLEAPTLFVEFHGNEAGLAQDVEFTQEIVYDLGCQEIIFENDSKAAYQLWEARHNLAYAFIHGASGKKLLVTDVCLPISELAGAINNARKTLEEFALVGGIVGHVGDGNFHVLLMVDKNDPKEMELTEKFTEHLVKYAIARGGTCTGEHGVGVGKKKYQRLEHGAAYDVMITIKKALDPKCILNPDKIIDKY
ncbi:FAD-binding oxidoreductase [Alkalihalobacterium chitinilyticum]|uniref:D-lactate dehydrogenase (cytochrome) n=1 Tax=Alkalihalobacterium chitinilyticum TaxID=2980103 RepID=A0ABT5VI91_9BACI|nr:FAD-linked oxidase C-terminal domain-containing protein [Alkalihalobacterium chitinilyticum]MDE5415174.1 FAD-binding protein [Alkalihalobacterium chitinilyticum]